MSTFSFLIHSFIFPERVLAVREVASCFWAECLSGKDKAEEAKGNPEAEDGWREAEEGKGRVRVADEEEEGEGVSLDSNGFEGEEVRRVGMKTL